MIWDQVLTGLWPGLCIALGLSAGCSIAFVVFMSIAAWNRRRRKPKHYVFPIMYPMGGKLRDEHVWSPTYSQAMQSVRSRYDKHYFLIGHGEEQQQVDARQREDSDHADQYR
jgi:hypothetical protein